MILHVDMDAFYASVEQRERPELRGKAVVVGGSAEGRGVVCAASYEARKFGVRSAMPAATAVRLCPHAEFLPTRMELYAEISEQIREIFARFTPLIEPLSLDEAFLDVSGSERLWGSAVEIGRKIKRAIRDELRLVASVGVAPNKFLAKLASDLEKPDGFVVVAEEEVLEFLEPLPVGRLWGVGKKGEAGLKRLGIASIGDIRRLPPQLLRDHFGKQGEHLYRLAHGEDDRTVTPDRQAKSISHETTFAEDIDRLETLRSWIVALGEQVAWRIRRRGLFASSAHLKLRYHDFTTITRSRKLAEPTHATQPILDAAIACFESVHRGAIAPIRLVGVGVSGLRDDRLRQHSLFDQQESTQQEELDAASDRIREKFGKGSLRRASAIRPDAEFDADSSDG